MKKIVSIFVIALFLSSGIVTANLFNKTDENSYSEWILLEDYDPLVDINVTFEVLAIRQIDTIDCGSDADFFVRLHYKNQLISSIVWEDQSYLYDCWKITFDVPDEEFLVNITIELYDENSDENILCDLCAGEKKSADISYDIRTGRWFGDDYLGDPSGYGRLCGCDDKSIYKCEYDCELFFKIYQNDYDEDQLPYYLEEYIYGTDPNKSNIGDDEDLDELPIEWEHFWGFNPFIYDDHKNLDYDDDSITNYEEYLTKDYGSDPFRKDIFLEYDFMETGPSGEENYVPEFADEILKTPFHRRNIVFHLDRTDGGGEIIPHEKDVSINQVLGIYEDYFAHNNPDNWRRSVFHYGMFVDECTPPGYGFSGDIAPYMGYIPGTNSFVISCRQMERSAIRTHKSVEYIYASAVMHEMGHNFGIRFTNPFGCDNRGCIYPWRLSFWLFWNYKSIMNYRYTYKILDYSDGSHGPRDFDDWKELNFGYFEIP